MTSFSWDFLDTVKTFVVQKIFLVCIVTNALQDFCWIVDFKMCDSSFCIRLTWLEEVFWLELTYAKIGSTCLTWNFSSCYEFCRCCLRSAEYLCKHQNERLISSYHAFSRFCLLVIKLQIWTNNKKGLISCSKIKREIIGN